MKEDFDSPLLVVAGFPRTGSTSIYRNLEINPGFAVPLRKELNFFCRPDQPLSAYKAHFSRRRQGQICVDVSPAYCLDTAVPARLHEAVPHARVVLQIREPAVWIQSLYTQMCSFTPRPPSFAEFLENPMMEQFKQQFRFSLKEGIYERSLASFAKVFGDNLLVTDFAAFEQNPLETLREIEAFAGAPQYFNADTVDVRAHNSSRLARRHPPQLRWLLGKEGVVQTASKVVPAPLLRRARSMLYYESGAGQSTEAGPARVTQDSALANDATAVDRETYVELFKTTRIRRGSELA